MKKHNFSAGPAILPASVMQQASEAALNYNNTGLSILEMSHRGKEIVAVMDEAIQSVKDIFNLPENYEVLYLTGGASTQFFMTAMNLLDQGQTAYYADTGAWSKKAYKEGQHFGSIEVIASSEDKNYTYIPKGFTVPGDAAYLHITTNNTIFGTQYKAVPHTESSIVADMSSDIFSREIDATQFDLIYAGAQKNLGPAGTTMVVVNKEILGKVNRAIPTMLDYRTHIGKKSAFNTPPVFPIYVCMLSLRWIKEQGGVAAIEQNNNQKADLLYNALDESSLFKAVVAKEDRSIMNVPFVMETDELNEAFLNVCTEAGISGVKGHRSVGGFRASIYNAMPIDSVKVLVDVIKEFERTNG
ncbi:MAG: 3-phosphoserine/phosphohydroxythreonine transaminase [Bacteroidota bacterium]